MNKFRQQLVLVLALLLVSLLLFSSVGAAQKDGPVVSLSSAQSEYSASEDVLVTVAYSNPTRHSVRILKWYTPSDGVEEPIFAVRLDGAPVAYTGAIYKRPAPNGGDYVTLKSGESLAYEVNLGDYYDLTGTGQYAIVYAVAAYDLYDEKGSSAKNRETLSSEPISLKVEGRASEGQAHTSAPASAWQHIVQRLYDGSADHPAECPQPGQELRLGIGKLLGSQRQRHAALPEWFGAYDLHVIHLAETHFTSISDAWDNAGVTFDCKCKQNYFAYVYPDPAVQHQPVQGLLAGAAGWNGLAGRYPDPRDEPLQRGRRDRRLRLRSDRRQGAGG